MPDIADSPASSRSRSEEADFALAHALQEQERASANRLRVASESKEDREIHTISDDDDEDIPILMSAARSNGRIAAAAAASVSASPATTTLLSSAPATAAACSSSPSPSITTLTPHPEKNEALHSMLAEFECGICADVIIGSVVLDCGHSYCKHCIDQWFRKKKICPVCRAKHKGNPLAVRTMDKAIAIMTDQLYTAEQKAERQERVIEIQKAEQEFAEQEAARQRQALERRQSRMMMVHHAVAGPADIMQRALLQHAGVRHMLHRRHPMERGSARPIDLIDLDDAESMELDEYDYEDPFLAPDDEDHDALIAQARGHRRGLVLPPVRLKYTVDMVMQRCTVCRTCCAIIEPGLLRVVQKSGVRPGELPPAVDPNRAHYHLSCFVHDQGQPRLSLAQLEQDGDLSLEIRNVLQSLIQTGAVARG